MAKGRRALSETGEAKERVLTIRLTDAERASIDVAANATGKGASTWARDLLLAAAEPPKKPTRKKSSGK